MKEFDKDFIERQISYFFDNEDLLMQAFTRKSYAKENGGASNEVLEFFGDEVLDFYVSKVLSTYYGYVRSDEEENFDQNKDYDEYVTINDITESDLTEIKKSLVDNKFLAHRIDFMGLKDYMFLGYGDEKQNVQDQVKVKADLFEAILGAIAIDSEWDVDKLENAVLFMLDMDTFLRNGGATDDDYVSVVQKWWQKNIGTVPNYNIEERVDTMSMVFKGVNGAEHYFEASASFIHDGYTKYFKGEGSTKADARYECASNIYKYLKENNLLETLRDYVPSEEELTDDVSINVLQELAQKKWCSMPEYKFCEQEEYDENGNAWWSCTCRVKSWSIEKTGTASSKKEAKKYAAYLVLCYAMGYKDRYTN